MAKVKTSNDWLARHLRDPYVKQAQKDNYRARSAYKVTTRDAPYPLLLIRIRIGSVFRSFVDPDPYSQYGSGSTYVNTYRYRIKYRQKVQDLRH